MTETTTELTQKERWMERQRWKNRAAKSIRINIDFVISPLYRIDIRKGLNALKREIPGGDTFMHLGLQRVIFEAVCVFQFEFITYESFVIF